MVIKRAKGKRREEDTFEIVIHPFINGRYVSRPHVDA
jgi:hypothetical protein